MAFIRRALLNAPIIKPKKTEKLVLVPKLEVKRKSLSTKGLVF
jgi:hypothetical protein